MQKNQASTLTTTRHLLALGVLIAALSGCSQSSILGAYYIDIDQGNLFDQDKVSDIEVGMTPRQVRFIMGTPLINDPFNQHRWDYLYSITHKDQLTIQQHIAIFFEDGQVAAIEQINDYSNP
ncbi:MAG: outer membrane protein assembly factor BamE [Cellvibrionaceae bacterium]|nr:outer membrane protein assembly factor BamE [Cellvibrionaceae bacterium]